jgi:hypothetical protein
MDRYQVLSDQFGPFVWDSHRGRSMNGRRRLTERQARTLAAELNAKAVTSDASWA